MRRKSAFTLIEVLIAVAIIAVLVGIVVAVSSSVQVDAQTRQTKLIMHSLQGILEEYRSQNGGQYPPISSGADTKQCTADFLKAAWHVPKCKDGLMKLSQYLDYSYSGTSGEPSGVKDAFSTSSSSTTTDNLIRFQPPSTVTNAPAPANPSKAPYFISAGPNVISGDSDDIYSYDPM